MSDIKTPTPAPSLADIAARISSEFALIKNHDAASNKNVVERAIRLGKTLRDTKERLGHGKWRKWLLDYCSDISERTATRYMKLDSPEFRAALGKNDKNGKSVTVSDLTLRKALALANPKSSDPDKKEPSASDEYDKVEDRLITKLEELAGSSPPETLAAAAAGTIQRIQESVTRLKPAATSPQPIRAE